MTKKLRFDIFTRDNFTCQYCGKNPIDHNIVLEVDHMISKKDGGLDDKNNLVTSCFDCNRGKSKKSIIVKDKINTKQQLKNAKEQLEQVKKMIKLRKIKKEINNKRLEWVNEYLNFGEDLNKRIFNLIKKHNKSGINTSILEKSLNITCDKFSDDEFYIKDFFKYFHGVLRNIKLEEENPKKAEYKKKINYALNKFYSKWNECKSNYLNYEVKLCIKSILESDPVGNIDYILDAVEETINTYHKSGESSYSNLLHKILIEKFNL